MKANAKNNFELCSSEHRTCGFDYGIVSLDTSAARRKLESLVEENWNVLSEATTPEMMRGFRKVGVLRAFEGFSDDLLWQAVSKKAIH